MRSIKVILEEIQGPMKPCNWDHFAQVNQQTALKWWGNIPTSFYSPGKHTFFNCDQAALWMVQSIRPSVLLSAHHIFFTRFSSLYHHEIFRSDYHWQRWCPYERSRSKVKVTEVKTQFSHFRTITPVWIHIWWWNDAQSLMWCRRGCPIVFKGHQSNFKVTYDKKSLILTQIGHFRTVTPVWIYWWVWNDAQSLKWHRRGALLFYKESSIKFQDHMGQKIVDFDLNFAFLDCNSSLTWPMAMTNLFHGHPSNFKT